MPHRQPCRLYPRHSRILCKPPGTCLTGDEKSIMLSSHPFPQTPGESPKTVCLYAEGEKDQYLSPITATLKVNGIERAHYILPVQILEHQNYRMPFEEMYHGKKKL